MCFQKNYWVDSEVAYALAKDFAQRTRSEHGEFWGLLHLDDLSAYCNAEEKRICSEGKVFFCCSPSQTTESTQAMDTGCGRSIRCVLSHLLDAWLMEEESMLMREGKMPASERRVLINHLVAEATEKAV